MNLNDFSFNAELRWGIGKFAYDITFFERNKAKR